MNSSWQGLLDENRRLRARLEQSELKREEALQLAKDALQRESSSNAHHCEALDALVALHSAVLCGQDTSAALEAAGALLRRAAA